jgi:hypothetical protein
MMTTARLRAMFFGATTHFMKTRALTALLFPLAALIARGHGSRPQRGCLHILSQRPLAAITKFRIAATQKAPDVP